MSNIILFKKRTKSKHEICSNAMDRVCDELSSNSLDADRNKVRDILLKVAYYGVMTVNTMPDNCDLTQLQRYFQIAELSKSALSLLSYKEIQQAFPIDKEYDGERWETKDYFYTIDVVNQYSPDERILNNIDELLWDYMNVQLFEFQINLMSIMSGINRFMGKKGIMEQFCEEVGIDTYTMQPNGELIRNERKPKLTLV